MAITLTLEDVAEISHEADRVLCLVLGKPDAGDWDLLPPAAKVLGKAAVKLHLDTQHPEFKDPHNQLLRGIVTALKPFVEG